MNIKAYIRKVNSIESIFANKIFQHEDKDDTHEDIKHTILDINND